MEDIIIKSPVHVDPSKIPKMPVQEFLFQKIREHLPVNGNKPWVTDVVTGKSITFSEVESMSRKIAGALWSRGFRKGDILFFNTYDTTTLNLVFFGVWICNGAVMGSCPDDGASELLHLIHETRPKFMMCDAKTEEKMTSIVKMLNWDVCLFSIDKTDGVTSIGEVLLEGTCEVPEDKSINYEEHIIFLPNTSGSTGIPKSAIHTHSSLLAAIWIGEYGWPVTSMLHLFSNFHVVSVIVACVFLKIGQSVYNMSKYSFQRYLQGIEEYKPEALGIFPFIIVQMSTNHEVKEFDISSVKLVFSTGSILTHRVKEKFKDKYPDIEISHGYGMTEMFLATSTLLSKKYKNCNFEVASSTKIEDGTSLSTGQLMPLTVAKVVDLDTGKVLGRNCLGELHFKSHHSMRGYFKRPKETAEVIDSSGWIRSGDVGYFDEDGHLYVEDRIKEVFEYKFHHISPSELENLILQHPAVLGAGVVGVPDMEADCLPRAYIVKRPGCKVTEEEIFNFVAENAAFYKHLRGGVVFINELPVSRNGKLRRNVLKQMAASSK